MSEYTPQVGDTVRASHWTDACTDTVRVTAVGEQNFLGLSSWNPEYECTFTAFGWVKVEPTPADRYCVFDNDGAVVTTHSFALACNARSFAGNACRVARFTFAEWIDQ